jgi:hypothetical protein
MARHEADSLKSFMTMRALLVLGLVVGGCTAKNPRDCGDGACTDPAFPFCDESGQLGGETMNECIAPSCTAGAFAECRGDTEVRCNTDGNNFDLVDCELGCDPTLGCRLCEPSQTACTNGSVATCDASGVIVESHACPLGCFEDEPRCRDIDPSNGLATFLDSVDAAETLDLSAGGTIDTSTGSITTSGGASITLPSFLVAAPSGGVPIRVIVADDVLLGDVVVTANMTHGGPALALLANGEIVISGNVSLAAGDVAEASLFCVGGLGFENINGNNEKVSGSGGGGHATAGGEGGAQISLGLPGGRAGAVGGTDMLEPLRGGCAAGGFSSNVNPPTAFGARGGGAIQLSSRERIRITGTIGAVGATGVLDGGRSGGGGGGGVLLEAPNIELIDGAFLARGGDGSGCDPANDICGQRGLGATATTGATAGGAPVNNPSRIQRGGGGGGGLGRIRINTKEGTFVQGNTFQLDGAVSTAVLKTR